MKNTNNSYMYFNKANKLSDEFNADTPEFLKNSNLYLNYNNSINEVNSSTINKQKIENYDNSNIPINTNKELFDSIAKDSNTFNKIESKSTETHPCLNLTKEIYIPDLNIENYRSNQFTVFQSIINNILYDFAAYPSIYCNINIIDLNLDNKSINQLSIIQYWSVLKGHKGSITEIKYLNKSLVDIDNNYLLSGSIEGLFIIWFDLQNKTKVIESKFLNEVKYEVILFKEYKKFNIYSDLYSFVMFKNTLNFKEYNYDNKTLDNLILNMSKFQNYMIAFADTTNITKVYNMEGILILEIKEDIKIDCSIIDIFQKQINYSINVELNQDNKTITKRNSNNNNKIVSIFADKDVKTNDEIENSNNIMCYRTDNKTTFSNILILGSSFNEGIRFYDCDSGLKLTSLYLEGDVTCIRSYVKSDINNNYVLISTGLGKVIIIKIDYKVKDIKQLKNIINDDEKNPNLTIDDKYIIVDKNYLPYIFKVSEIDLKGSVFDLRIWNLNSISACNYIGLAIDNNSFDVKSNSAFKFLEYNFTQENSNIFDNEIIIHRSYIINFDIYYSYLKSLYICATIGLDKRIKLFEIIN